MFFVGAVVATADGGAARGKDFSLLFVFAIAIVLVLNGCDRTGYSISMLHHAHADADGLGVHRTAEGNSTFLVQ